MKAVALSEWQRNYELDPNASKILFAITKEVVGISRKLSNKKQLVEALDDIGLPLERSIEGQDIEDIGMYNSGMYAWLAYIISIAKPTNEAKLDEYLAKWADDIDKPEAQEALFDVIHLLAQYLHRPQVKGQFDWDIRQYLTYCKTPDSLAAKDYNIGIARGLLALINDIIMLCQLDLTVMNLTGLEKSVLACIAKQPRITPTEILKKLEKDNRQQMSNILRGLKARHLVDAYEAGRHNWYNLTQEGYQIIDYINKDEETAAADTFKIALAGAAATQYDLSNGLYVNNVQIAKENAGLAMRLKA